MTSNLTYFVAGGAGQMEVEASYVDNPRGLALIAHPHPLFGGTPQNKVVTTLAKAAQRAGLITLCPAFRGVGKSAGTHDDGRGETEDLALLLAWAKSEIKHCPTNLVLMGFSFGAFCQTRLAAQLSQRHHDEWRLCAVVLVGLATGVVEKLRHYNPEPPWPGSLVIHGEADTTVPLSAVLQWAKADCQPITVFPETDHFFHRRLSILHDCVLPHLEAKVKSD